MSNERENIAAADLLAPDLLQACPVCGDLWPNGERRCDNCSSRLAEPPLEPDERGRRGLSTASTGLRTA